MVGESADQVRIDAFEDDAGEVLGDLFLVAAASARASSRRQVCAPCWGLKAAPAKEQAEGAQAVRVLLADEGCQVDFVVGAGAGAGAAIVEAPDAAVGEDTPTDAPVRADVGGGEIAQELGMGRAGAARSSWSRASRGRPKRLLSATARASG